MTVSVKRLDHVNLRTTALEAMVDWYGTVLGMTVGPRPDFPFPGAWLYAEGEALVHLIGVDARPETPDALSLEHFAFAASGFSTLVERARARGERVEIRKVPGFPIVQVNLWDPDGNHLHVDFHADEVPPEELG